MSEFLNHKLSFIIHDVYIIPYSSGGVDEWGKVDPGRLGEVSLELNHARTLDCDVMNIEQIKQAFLEGTPLVLLRADDPRLKAKK